MSHQLHHVRQCQFLSRLFVPLLMWVCLRAPPRTQSSGPMTALFLSGAAPNLLCLELARGLGVNIPSPWIAWLSAASVPAFACIILCPLMVYKMVPPDLKVGCGHPLQHVFLFPDKLLPMPCFNHYISLDLMNEVARDVSWPAHAYKSLVQLTVK